MEPRQHTLRVPNTGSKGTHEINFYDWGPQDAADVVMCVHGLTRNARDFDFIAQALASGGRRVLALDMAGRGHSEWLANPMEYNYATYTADCLAILNNFHLRGVDWLGTSMGGLIGMMIAATVPNRIRKLVMNDIGCHLSGLALQRIYTYVRGMPARFETREAGETYLKDAFAPFKITDLHIQQHFLDHTLQQLPDGGWRIACDPAIGVPIASQTNNYEDMRDVSLAELWEKLQIPTLIIRGGESDILDETTVRAMRSTNAKAQEYLVKGVGHAPYLAEPQQYQRVVDWLIYGDGGYFAG